MATSSKPPTSEKEIKVTKPCLVEHLAKMQRRMNELMDSNQVALELLSQFENDLEQAAKEFYEEIEVVNNFFEDVEDTEKQCMVKYDEIVSELDAEFDNIKMDFHREIASSKKKAKEEYLKKQDEAERNLNEILYKLENTMINVHKEGSVKTVLVKDYARMDPKSVRDSLATE